MSLVITNISETQNTLEIVDDNLGLPEHRPRGTIGVLGGTLYVYVPSKSNYEWVPVIKRVSTKIVEIENEKEWTIDHNFNTEKILTLLFDEDDIRIEPLFVQNLSLDSIKYVFDSNKTGTAVLISISGYDFSIYDSSMEVYPDTSIGIDARGIYINKSKVLTAYVPVVELIVPQNPNFPGGYLPSILDVPETIPVRDNNSLIRGTIEEAQKLSDPFDIQIVGEVSGGVLGVDGSQNVSINTALSLTGVTAGDYYKVTVDNKGRVSNGKSNLELSDLPPIEFSNISNIPTTIEDLGVVNVYNKNEVDNLIVDSGVY